MGEGGYSIQKAYCLSYMQVFPTVISFTAEIEGEEGAA
jgi:hypothetical protein